MEVHCSATCCETDREIVSRKNYRSKSCESIMPNKTVCSLVSAEGKPTQCPDHYLYPTHFLNAALGVPQSPAVASRLTRMPKARCVGCIAAFEPILCAVPNGAGQTACGLVQDGESNAPRVASRLTRTPQARCNGCVAAFEPILCAVPLRRSNGVCACARLCVQCT